MEGDNTRPAPAPFMAKVTANTADGEADKVQGHADGDPVAEQFDLDVRRIFPFGIRARPPAGVWAAVMPCGSLVNGAMVGAESKQYGPSNLADGEVALYNSVAGLLILFDKNGKISITSAAGQTVEINGNTWALPQWDGPGGFTTPFNAFVGAIAAITPNPPVTLVNCAAALGTIITAANTLKGAMTTASNFASAKAKNG